jgi:hypothetical protein
MPENKGVAITVDGGDILLRMNVDRAEELLSALLVLYQFVGDKVPLIKRIKGREPYLTKEIADFEQTPAHDLLEHLLNVLPDALMEAM